MGLKEDGADTIKAMAHADLHDAFYAYFRKSVSKDATVLDYGAGAGAFSQRLRREGYAVSACDHDPSLFQLPEVECHPVRDNRTPFADHSFDVVVAIEVFEHLFEVPGFFAECDRLLKPGGQLFLTTPNPMSFKSRWRFFWRGHFYGFPPLDLDDESGMQHIQFMTLDQIRYFARRRNLDIVDVGVDKRQRTSRLFWPVYCLIRDRSGDPAAANSAPALFGRTLFLTLRKI